MQPESAKNVRDKVILAVQRTCLGKTTGCQRSCWVYREVGTLMGKAAAICSCKKASATACWASTGMLSHRRERDRAGQLGGRGGGASPPNALCDAVRQTQRQAAVNAQAQQGRMRHRELSNRLRHELLQGNPTGGSSEHTGGARIKRHRGLTDRLCHELVMQYIQVCSLRSAFPGQGHASVANLIPVCCQALIHFQWSCQPSVSLSCIACVSHTSLGHRLSQAERHLFQQG